MPEDNFYGFTPVASGSPVYLERKRINSLFEKATQSPIVSVVAGTGYGKTCAVYAFSKSINIHTAWIQVSDLDNLGEHFWENFVSAVSIINRDIAEKLRQIGFPATEQQFERFVAIPREHVIPNKKYLFVYDDIHLITNRSVLRFLEHSMAALFPNYCSVLISRTESALNISKLVSKKLLARITEDDLRFNRDELVSYFRLHNIVLEPRRASAIYHDTEGWAFAVHLAFLTLRNSAGTSVYIPQALRSNTFKLIDTEIMSGVSLELRRFLIKLSLVENLNSGLLREIAQDPSLIKEMENIASFIRFDSYLNSYRIHNFFLEYLKGLQDELSLEEKKEVWTKAALWCDSNNLKIDAIIYHEKTGDYKGLFKIANSLPMFMPAQTASFLFDITNRMPKSIYRECPEIIIIRNRILNCLGLFEQNRTETLEILPDFMALDESPEKHRLLRALYLNLGFAGYTQSVISGQYDFIEFFREAVAESRQTDAVIKPPINVIAMSSYACRVMAPAAAEDIKKYTDMIGEITPHLAEAMGGCLSGMHELARGEFAFFRGELPEAEKLLSESIVKAREKQQYEIENRALFYLLRIHLSRGEARKIENVLRHLRSQLEKPFYLNRYFYNDIVSGWYHIQTGQKDKAASWLKSSYEESDLNARVQGLERLVKAKYCFAEKCYPAAIAVMKSRGDAENLLMGDIEMKALEAACRYRLHDKEGAFKALQDAYNMASPAGLFMPFVELGKDMRSLAEAALNAETTALPAHWLEETRRKAMIYAKKLFPQAKQTRIAPGHRKELLSRREKAVLIGLSQGLTREEIAGAASISPNTVKSAVRSIYNKLAALNKADAVRIATERGIL